MIFAAGFTLRAMGSWRYSIINYFLNTILRPTFSGQVFFFKVYFQTRSLISFMISFFGLFIKLIRSNFEFILILSYFTFYIIVYLYHFKIVLRLIIVNSY